MHARLDPAEVNIAAIKHMIASTITMLDITYNSFPHLGHFVLVKRY